MKTAVIGGGIAGLACAYTLERKHRLPVTLFEAADYLGGHTHTVDVTVDHVTHPVDTGFLVFNHRTYPLLTRLFAELEVPIAASEMTFSVSLAGGVEWAGTDLASLFAQPANLLRPRFLGMLRDMLRFNRAATMAAQGPDDGVSLGVFLDAQRYGKGFRDWYLLPMAGAIWSCPTATMLDYPFATFARFCFNHGLLQVTRRPQWYTVAGGGREYVHRIAAHLTDVRLALQVSRVRCGPGGVYVRTALGEERFDRVVLACHGDQALDLIEAPTPAEQAVLGAVRYQPNAAWLHTDIALLPRRRRAWAAWNYLAGAQYGNAERPVAVSYLINKLQPLPFTTPVIVTLNPATPPRAETVFARFDYAHPIFDRAALAAQRDLARIQGADRLWFAGAWCGYGFHEDGLKAGLAAAEQVAASFAPTRYREAA